MPMVEAHNKMKFYENRKYTFGASGLIILLGLVFLFVNKGLNLDLDFSSGTSLLVEIGAEFSHEDVMTIVTDVTEQDNPVIQRMGDEGTQVFIKTKEIDTIKRDEIFTRLQEKYELSQDALIEANNVGASTSFKLFTDAAKAVGYSLILMLIYITFRFQFTSGLAAIINLLHNVAVLLGIYAIFQFPINSTFVAAVLTIVGYSINDTIVVFDRIRENRKTLRRETFAYTSDISITQTLTRSIYTSLTTLFTIGTLYIMGVPSVQEFALPIIIGIFVGTYASICIAAPMWVMLHEFFDPRKRAKKRPKNA